MFKSIQVTFLAAVAGVSVVGMSGGSGNTVLAADMPVMAGKLDIVDTAMAAGTFKTLIAAAKAAGLVDALKAPGPITIFAPTDDAFAKLPAGTLDDLLKPENKAKLVAILKYHIVSGKVPAKDVSGMTSAKTMEGHDLKFSSKDGGVLVNNAQVTKADVMASNGVIHVIDAVLMPE